MAALSGRAWSQPTRSVVGFISTRGAGDSTALVAAFRQGLGGYVRDASVSIESRWADGDYRRLPTLVADLLAQKPAVIVAVGGEPAALAVKAATSTVPIVFIVGNDPVALGLVQSMSRPGGNATGLNVFTSQIESKRLGLLRELLPGAVAFAALLNPKFSSIKLLEEIRETARLIGTRIDTIDASTDAELDQALDGLPARGVQGLLVTADPYFDTRRDRIIAAASRLRIPGIYQSRDYVLAGGLMSYGISYTDVYHQAGVYAGRILRGVSPAALPVVQPVRFEMVLNLKTAAALGLVVPVATLSLTDEVIE